jgi:hypothetical protein
MLIGWRLCFFLFFLLHDTHSLTDCSCSRRSRLIVIPAKACFARGCNFTFFTKKHEIAIYPLCFYLTFESD